MGLINDTCFRVLVREEHLPELVTLGRADNHDILGRR